MEMKKANKIGFFAKIMSTLLLGVSIFVWWFQFYPFALGFQEQYQMFLFNSSYFTERITVVGGLADYLSEFLVQFYYIPVLGAAILAISGMLLQTFTWLCLCKFGVKNLYFISFVPTLLVWAYMGEPDVLLCYPTGILLALACFQLYPSQASSLLKALYTAVALPVLYWLIGPLMLVFCGLTALLELRNKQFILASGTLIYGLLSIFCIGYFFMPQYPWTDIWMGINYNRFTFVLRGEIGTLHWLIPLLLVFLPYLLSFLRLPKKTELVGALGSLVILGAGIWYMPHCYDKDTYEIIRQDQLIRAEKWSEVVQQAEQYQPFITCHAVGVNLALGMNGQLGERMFDFYQPGTQGFIAPYLRDYMTNLTTEEAFFQLGMVNSALRYASDLQESTGNNRKSGRLTKRMIECYLINGNYPIAQKHINYLKQTLFYKDWAEEAETYLQNEEKINNHSLYGRLRSLRYQEDFLYNLNEIDKMMGLLYIQNNANTLAQEYFYAMMLVNRNLESFYTYLPEYAEKRNGYIPVNFQEALCMIWANSHSNLDNMPVKVYNEVKQQMMEFASKYSKNPKDPSLLYGHLGKSYWSYYFLKRHAENASTDGNTGATTIQ